MFAPTDDAFATALGVDETTVGSFPVGVLTSVLTYHVSPSRRDAESVTTSDEQPTLNREKITVDNTVVNPGRADEANTVVNPGRADEANVVVTDVPAPSGIIHAIELVLDPTL